MTRLVTLHVKPKGDFTKLDILNITGIRRSEKYLDTLAKYIVVGVLLVDLITTSASAWC